MQLVLNLYLHVQSLARGLLLHLHKFMSFLSDHFLSFLICFMNPLFKWGLAVLELPVNIGPFVINHSLGLPNLLNRGFKVSKLAPASFIAELLAFVPNYIFFCSKTNQQKVMVWTVTGQNRYLHSIVLFKPFLVSYPSIQAFPYHNQSTHCVRSILDLDTPHRIACSRSACIEKLPSNFMVLWLLPVFQPGLWSRWNPPHRAKGWAEFREVTQ